MTETTSRGRVKVVQGHKRVRAYLGSELVADTSLPLRYYLPLSDLRRELLRPSGTATHCPYKGTAGYWSVQVNGKLHEDLVWIYRLPLPESQKVAGLACFYNEKVDLTVDGVRQERASSPFS